MFEETFRQILSNVWPMCIIVLTIIISLRVTYLLLNKEKIKLYKDLLVLLFIIYILCLFYVVTFQDVSWSTSNYIPFHEMMRYEIGSYYFFKNIAGNLIMFVPFGFFSSYFLKTSKLSPIIIISLLVSTVIEVTQLSIGRVFDIDDIILNVLGGILGSILYIYLYKIKEKLPDFLKKTWLYNIIILTIIMLTIIYLSKILIGG